MHAAVDDVHHRHRQDVGVGAADVAVQRDLQLVGGGLGDGQADAEDGVGAEAGLVVGAVELDQRGVDRPLLEARRAPRSSSAISPLTNADGAWHALAAVAVAAVAQLDRLVLAGGRAGRHRGPAPRAAVQQHLDLDRRVAPGVEDLAAHQLHDLAHRIDDRSRAPPREPAAHGPPTHRQAGDRHGRQQGHRQGGGADAGRRGLRRGHRRPHRVGARGDGRRARRRHRPRRPRRSRSTPARTPRCGRWWRRPPSALGGVDILVNSAAKPMGQAPPPKLRRRHRRRCSGTT